MYNDISLSPVKAEMSALKNQFGAAKADVELAEIEIGSLIQLALWDRSSEALLSDPALAGMRLMNVAPLTYLVHSTESDVLSKLEAVITDDVGVLSDLSHSRTLFSVAGAAACDLIRKGMAIDLDEKVFPINSVKQTAIAHMGVTCYRTGSDSFELFVFRGFAESFLAWLVEASHGFELKVA